MTGLEGIMKYALQFITKETSVCELLTLALLGELFHAAIGS